MRILRTKKAKLNFVIAAFLSCFCMMLVTPFIGEQFGFANSFSNVYLDGEYIGDDSTPLPEGFETFSYNGQSYTLPTTMEEIYTMGFTLEEMYDENYILPTEYEESLILNDENGYAGMIGISNYTGEEIPLGKAQVNYFYIENYN